MQKVREEQEIILLFYIIINPFQHGNKDPVIGAAFGLKEAAWAS